MGQGKTKETLASGHFMSVINNLMQLRKVESTFSRMKGIVDPQSASLNVESVSSIQTIKYHLEAAGLSSVGYVTRSDVNYSLEALDKAKEETKQLNKVVCKQAEMYELQNKKSVSKKSYAQEALCTHIENREEHKARIDRVSSKTKQAQAIILPSRKDAAKKRKNLDSIRSS